MDVTAAVQARSSIRSFLPTPVSNDVLRSLLEVASRAASGGNVQPWRVYVVNGQSMSRLREYLVDQPPIEAPEYDIYPAKLTEPYRSNRFAIGEQMYATLGIEREDKAGRLRQFAHNGDFFGAPAALFCFVDRQMGPPQWSDLGMFLQTSCCSRSRRAWPRAPRSTGPSGTAPSPPSWAPPRRKCCSAECPLATPTQRHRSTRCVQSGCQ